MKVSLINLFFIWAQILQRDAKSFDVKRSTYMAMNMIMQNLVAESLNMEGRRGDKTAFVKYKIFTTVAGNHILMVYFFEYIFLIFIYFYFLIFFLSVSCYLFLNRLHKRFFPTFITN